MPHFAHPKRNLNLENENPDRLIEHDYTEVDPIVFTGLNLGLSVYYGTTDYLWTSHADPSTLTKLDMFSIILGELADDNYYQTYFQFPSAKSPGIYESFTCTTRYHRYEDQASVYAVRNYEGT